MACLRPFGLIDYNTLRHSGARPQARSRASSTRYGREPGIQMQILSKFWIPGSALRAAPE
jgi:hypothetical protein